MTVNIIRKINHCSEIQSKIKYDFGNYSENPEYLERLLSFLESNIDKFKKAKNYILINYCDCVGKAFLFTLITCGIYGIYWAYKIGKDIYAAQTKRNMPGATDNSVLYLILDIFGLSIVTYCLAQSEVNKMADAPANN